MSYYYEKTNEYLSSVAVKRRIGDVSGWSESRKQEAGLFPGYYLSQEYNNYSETLDSVGASSWVKYTNDSDLQVANPRGEYEETSYSFPAYFNARPIVDRTGTDRANQVTNAKRVVYNEVSERMLPVITASMALRYNALGLSDSAGPVASKMGASDSDLLELAYNIEEGGANYDSDFPALGTDFLGSSTLVANVTSGQNLDFTGLPTSDPGVTGQLWRDSDVVKVSL